MNIKELMVGNLINASIYYETEEAKSDLEEEYSADKEFKLIQVEGFFEREGKYFIDTNDYEQLDFVRFEPIKLTEEWLLKLGFKRHHTDYFNDVLIVKNVVDWNTGIPNNKDFVFMVYPNELGSAIVVKNSILLSYVHQVQNLYFSITGNELQSVS